MKHPNHFRTYRMNPLEHAAVAFALSLPILALGGCQDGNQATVTGRVHFNARALERGNVVFHPTGQGPTAIGSIQADGGYSLSTGRTPGLLAGQYRVTVQSREPVILPTDNQSGPKAGKRITPEIYGDVATTPLSFDVKPGVNVIDLELQEKK